MLSPTRIRLHRWNTLAVYLCVLQNTSILSVSNLVPVKRVNYLIDAFHKAFSGDNMVILEIAGQGSEYASLQAQIEHLNMEKQIVLLGQLSRDAVAMKMKESDAFVMASKSETFGIVYAEAMACGNPTIGTLNGGSNELLSENGSFSIPVTDDISALTNALLFVRNNIKMYNRKEISKRIIEHYSQEAVMTRLEELYYGPVILLRDLRPLRSGTTHLSSRNKNKKSGTNRHRILCLLVPDYLYIVAFVLYQLLQFIVCSL